MKNKTYGAMLTLYSLVAWIASGTLVLERLELFKNPNYIPTCDFGLFFSCSNIMKTEQASLFGFPNPLLGIVGFAITGTLGILIMSGMKLPRWINISLMSGIIASFGLIGFFWYTSVIVVMLLCPWCMVVWAMVIPMLFHTMSYNFKNGTFGQKSKNNVLPPVWASTLIVYAIIVSSILIRFYEYIF